MVSLGTVRRPIASTSLSWCGSSSELRCTKSACERCGAFTTNSPVRWMFLAVSFRSAPRRPMETPIIGGSFARIT